MQIVSARKNQAGNFVLEVKCLPEPRLSTSGENVHVAGTIGWAEAIGLTEKDPEGNEQPLKATIDIRYANPHYVKPKKNKPLTAEDLKKAGKSDNQV